MTKPPSDEVKQGAPDWVVTFGDMMSLLLCFFVLLLSFSTMEMEKFKVVAGFMRQAFGVQKENSYTGVPMGTTIMTTQTRTSTTAADEIELIERIRRALEQAGLGGKGSVNVTRRGVAVRLEGEVVFESGSAELKRANTKIFDEIVRIARSRPGEIEVEGHTDDVPIATSTYPSNWELSTARAGQAVRYMIERGMPRSRIKAVGYADTRPVAPNQTPEDRAKNRRVEILFVRPPAARAGTEPSPAPPSSRTKAEETTEESAQGKE